MSCATRRNTPEWRAQVGPDRVKVSRSPADAGGDTSPGCRKLQEGIVVTTVLICDERRSVREGLTRVMSAVPGVHRIDCGAHGDELLARFSRQPVDVVLIGTQRAVPTGVEATRRLVAAHPQANVIVFGAPDDAGSIAAAIAGGTPRAPSWLPRWRTPWPARRCPPHVLPPIRVCSSPSASCRCCAG